MGKKLPEVSEIRFIVASLNKKGYRYEQMAKITGIEISTLNRIKSGVIEEPKYTHLKKIYECLGEYFYEDFV